MTIPRATLTYNLNTISQAPDITGFDNDYTGRLIPTDQATSKSAKEVIFNTFKQAADLEDTKKRIWIERNNQAESLGHLILKKAKMLPAEVQLLPVVNEERDLLKVEVMLAGNDTYTVHVHESAFKKCQLFSDMLEDLPESDTIPVSAQGLNARQLDLAFNFIKRGNLPSGLNMGDRLALLRFVNYLDHSECMEALFKQLANIPLKKKAFANLPYDLGIQWAKARPSKECAAIIASFKGKNPLIQDIGIDLINSEHIPIRYFKDLNELKSAVETSRIKVLNLHFVNGLSTNDFKELLEASSEVISLRAPDDLTNEHLAYINTLSNLQSLDFNHCKKISDAGLEHLKTLSNLQTLNLNWCGQITDAGLKHLKTLSKLEKLDLWLCSHITDTGLEHLKTLANLQTLDLRMCDHITDAGLEHLKTLAKLQSLDLSGCDHITNSGLEHLQELSTLEILDLSFCSNITDGGLEHLKTLSNLKSLDLERFHKITNTGLEHLKTLSSLQTLSLSTCCNITDAGLEHLKTLANLQTLNLESCNKITDAGLELLQELSKLEVLNISWCYMITHAGLEHLKGLSNLHILDSKMVP